MAPKKNVNDLTKKVAKKRATKAKPVKKDLNSPKIKLQITNIGDKPPKIERKVTSQRKIELANEVAQEQLARSSDCYPIVLPSIIKAPINAEPQATIIKPTSKRKKKPTPKLAALSDAIILVKKTTKNKEKAKDMQKPILKDKKIVNKIMAETKHTNAFIMKKPGPKSKTLPLVEQKVPEILAQETIGLKKKTKQRKVAKRRTVQNREDIFDGSTNKWEDIIEETPVKKSHKRKKPSLIPETGTMIDSEETTAKKSRVRPCSEFTSERLNGNKLKVTRIQDKAATGAVTMLGQCHGAAPVLSRSNSIHSNSNLSWTIDISTSDTTSCLTVSSTDFVRYNKKLPFIQVENGFLNGPVKEDIKEKLLKNDSLSSGSVSKSSDSTDTDLDVPVNKPDLNLSTSSVTTKSSRSKDMSNTELFNLKLAEILNNTKMFFKDLNKWIVCDDDNTATFSTLLEADKIEKDLITDCENFENIFKDGNSLVSKNLNLKNCSENNNRSTKDDEIIVNYKEVVNNKDCSATSRLDLEAGLDFDGGREKNREKFPVNNPDIATAEKTYPNKSNSSSETFTSDNYNYLSFDDKVCDDEDALSIFAESITGIESSRMSTVSNMSVQEPRSLDVYVPKPTRPWIQERYTYQPTRIGINSSTKIRIANKNADSSSIHSETDLVMKAKVLLGDANRMSSLAFGTVLPEVEQVYEPPSGSVVPEVEQAYELPSGSVVPDLEQAYEPPSGSVVPDLEQAYEPPSGSVVPELEQANESPSGSVVPEVEQAYETLCDSADLEAEQANKHRRMFTLYDVMHPMKSSLYRGYCFFHLSTQCKKTISCRYPHVDIDKNIAVCRLAVLTDDNLIEEYLLTARYKSLRRKFGILFIQECKRREATRILMEIAIDLGLGVVEWEDNALNVSVLETALLHLNTISCESCVDLLLFENKGTMLCDALLSCMANSQNFAQFKRAFEKLASFMAQILRPVNIDIVGNILERICILPAEDSLARGMLCLMQNTSSRIFNNGMANSFETQLSIIDSNVLESYLVAKKAALMSLVARDASRRSSDFDNLKNLDTKATTNFNRTINKESIRHLFKSPSAPAPKQRFPGWRSRRHALTTNQRNGTNL